jgi:Zn-dependent protease with chaperone function
MDTKRRFPGISARTYQHPADRAALAAMRKVPGFDFVLRKLIGTVGERSLRLAFLASSVRVSERQFPDIWRSYLEACDILDIHPPPSLFVAQTPFVNAGAIGVDEPFIVLNSGMLILLDDAELQCVLGHELGHVQSDHVLYKTMLRLLMRLSIVAFSIPIGGMALYAITTALLEWDRKSELSADRAGLLVCQDPEVAMRVDMKLAGGGNTDQMNVDEFLLQAEEYRAGGTVVDSVLKLFRLLGRTHPFPVLRLAELKKWTDSGDYDRILEGEYEQRTDDHSTSVYEEIVKSGASYKEDVEGSPDPLFRLARDIGSGLSNAATNVSEAASQAASGARSWFRRDRAEDDEPPTA